jgi:hypothetical protein
MVCQACGSAVEQGGRFCPHCGAQIVAAAPPPGQPPQYASYPAYAPIPYIPRVQRHLQTLGTLWCVYALYRIVSGIFGLFVFRAITWHHRWNPDWPLNRWGDYWGHGWMHMVPFLIAMMITASLFGLFVGYSLLTRQTWGRILAIVAGVVVLFKPLLGTALGIYTLWVLAPTPSGMEYDSMVDAGYRPGMAPPR